MASLDLSSDVGERIEQTRLRVVSSSDCIARSREHVQDTQRILSNNARQFGTKPPKLGQQVLPEVNPASQAATDQRLIDDEVRQTIRARRSGGAAISDGGERA